MLQECFAWEKVRDMCFWNDPGRHAPEMHFPAGMLQECTFPRVFEFLGWSFASRNAPGMLQECTFFWRMLQECTFGMHFWNALLECSRNALFLGFLIFLAVLGRILHKIFQKCSEMHFSYRNAPGMHFWNALLECFRNALFLGFFQFLAVLAKVNYVFPPMLQTCTFLSGMLQECSFGMLQKCTFPRVSAFCQKKMVPGMHFSYRNAPGMHFLNAP